MLAPVRRFSPQLSMLVSAMAIVAHLSAALLDCESRWILPGFERGALRSSFRFLRESRRTELSRRAAPADHRGQHHGTNHDQHPIADRGDPHGGHLTEATLQRTSTPSPATRIPGLPPRDPAQRSS